MYGLSLTAIILYYMYYTGAEAGDCKTHEFFISFNMVSNAVVSAVEGNLDR